jgi:hypothetical protein
LRAGAATAGLVATGGLAGCSGNLNPLSSGGSQIVNSVPEDSDALTYIDMAAVLEDEGLREVTNAWLEIRAESEFYEGPEDFEAALDQWEDDTGLDIRQVSTVSFFFEFGGQFMPVSQDFAGAIITANWATEDVIDSLEESRSDLDYEEAEYEGTTIYEPQTEQDFGTPAWVGELSDGEWVLGSESAVEDVIDVQAGNEDKLDEELQEGFSNTRSAPIRFVSRLPTDQLPEEINQQGSTFSFDAFRNVDYVAGAVYQNGENRGVETTMQADDEDAASDIADVSDGLVSLARSQSRREWVSSALDEIEVQQNGTSVTITFEQAIEDIVEAIESANQQSGGGSGGSTRTPQASFAFEYRGSDNVLTITHQGGDSIRRDELFVQGTGFTSAGQSVDMVRGGPWQGTAGGTVDGRPAVVAGDRVTVGAESNCQIRLVWQSREGGSSATLGLYRGPDA